MSKESNNILSGIINTSIREFKALNNEEKTEYDITKIHRIIKNEFEQEGYFMIICTQEIYDNINERDILLWKVYKTEKYYIVIEFDQCYLSTENRDVRVTDFSIKNYIEYDRYNDSEDYIWNEFDYKILGIRLPDTFKLVEED